MKNTSTLFITISLFVAGLVMAGFAGNVWYQNEYLDEERTFWATVENSLSAGQYSKITEGSQGGAFTRETQLHNFMGDIAVEGTVVTTDSGNNPDSVTAITRAFTDEEFIRYEELKFKAREIAQRLEDAQGIWAISEVNPATGESLLIRSLASSLFLHGNFDGDARSAIMDKLRDGVYEVDFDNDVAMSDEDGRPVYVYRVSVDTGKYSLAFAEYLRQLGQNELAEQVEARENANQGEGQPQAFTFGIDARSRTLVSTSNGQSNERYTGFGTQRDIVKPDEFIQFSELQTRLNE